MDELGPLGDRDRASILLPEWLVRMIGPYPDEVGWIQFLGKWLLVGLIAARLVHGVIDHELGKALGQSFATIGVLLIAAAALQGREQ